MNAFEEGAAPAWGVPQTSWRENMAFPIITFKQSQPNYLFYFHIGTIEWPACEHKIIHIWKFSKSKIIYTSS